MSEYLTIESWASRLGYIVEKTRDGYLVEKSYEGYVLHKQSRISWFSVETASQVVDSILADIKTQYEGEP